jgi:nucleotide-binding universal stress UspA family protein
MTRRIICPTDLSASAQNATAYAAKLCQLTGATLQLVHSEPITPLLAALAGKRKSDDVRFWTQSLTDQANEISKLFNISCSADVSTDNVSISELLRSYSGTDSLIVMGTNGHETFFQEFFGSNTFNVAVSHLNKLLIIPEDISYHTPSRIAVAWDYHTTEKAMNEISSFAREIKCTPVYVHVSTHDTLISEDVYRARRELMQDISGREDEIEFYRLTANDVQNGLCHFMANKHADMLVIPIRNGRLVRDFFRLISSPVCILQCPILITAI